MATKASLSHIERTAEEPREDNLHQVILTKIIPINPHIRLFRLTPNATCSLLTFKPGQWLDVHIPSLPRPGGFTITSSPSLLSSSTPYLELAVQKSPSNPPAAWLWRDEKEILGKKLAVRVGGSFCWPPERDGSVLKNVKRVLFVAGGVGVNPLMSIVSFLAEQKRASGKLGFEVRFLYTVRDPGVGMNLSKILFYDRLREVFDGIGSEGDFMLFLTKGDGERDDAAGIEKRRINEDDLLDALGPAESRNETVLYVCGVPGMTDEFVDKAMKAEGMVEGNVLCEKWW